MQKTIFFPLSNTGGSAYIIDYFKSQNYRVLAGDANPMAIGRFISDNFFQLPYQREPNYFEIVKEIIKSEKVDVYVTMGENESLVVSRDRQEYLDMGCIPTAANLKTMELGVDKCELFTFLQNELDIPLPVFHSVKDLDSFEEGLEKLKGKKICLKPAITSGSRGFVVIQDESPDIQQLFSQRVSFPTVSKDYLRSNISNTKIPKMIMMEFLDGENFNASLVGKNGDLIFSSVHTREQVKDGLSTRGRIVYNKEIVEINRKIAKALNLTGFIVGQFIGNKLIEINPRWSTSIIFNSVNEYSMGVKVWTGEEIIIDPADVKVHNTLVYERYYETIIHDENGKVFNNG